MNNYEQGYCKYVKYSTKLISMTVTVWKMNNGKVGNLRTIRVSLPI